MQREREGEKERQSEATSRKARRRTRRCWAQPRKCRCKRSSQFALIALVRWERPSRRSLSTSWKVSVEIPWLSAHAWKLLRPCFTLSAIGLKAWALGAATSAFFSSMTKLSSCWMQHPAWTSSSPLSTTWRSVVRRLYIHPSSKPRRCWIGTSKRIRGLTCVFLC